MRSKADWNNYANHLGLFKLDGQVAIVAGGTVRLSSQRYSGGIVDAWVSDSAGDF